mmetsp:Transcript_36077/g.91163  ORF Transcript_36077/g.91163 Transcript_36077/m.91163 type:complete len:245 (-) Transcript_36077:815-1549(-)
MQTCVSSCARAQGAVPTQLPARPEELISATCILHAWSHGGAVHTCPARCPLHSLTPHASFISPSTLRPTLQHACESFPVQTLHSSMPPQPCLECYRLPIGCPVAFIACLTCQQCIVIEPDSSTRWHTACEVSSDSRHLLAGNSYITHLLYPTVVIRLGPIRFIAASLALASPFPQPVGPYAGPGAHVCTAVLATTGGPPCERPAHRRNVPPCTQHVLCSRTTCWPQKWVAQARGQTAQPRGWTG